PGLRVYAKSTGLPKVLGGLGVAIISTSQGLLTDRQANNKKVGGEVLAYVWEAGEQCHVSARLRSPSRPASTSRSTARPSQSGAPRVSSPRICPHRSRRRSRATPAR